MVLLSSLSIHPSTQSTGAKRRKLILTDKEQFENKLPIDDTGSQNIHLDNGFLQSPSESCKEVQPTLRFRDV